MKVGSVNCDKQRKVCDHFGKTENIVFYPAGDVNKDSGKVSHFKSLIEAVHSIIMNLV